MAGAELWAIDTEWGFRAGRLDRESAWEPVVLCLVGILSGERLAFWGWDPRLPAFFRDHAGDCFIAHYAIAEMKYLYRLDITPPARWFDTFVAWRRATNAPGNLDAGLSEALHQLGLPHLAPAIKDELRQKILRLKFDPGSADDRRAIIDYCLSDCDGTAALYRRLAGRIDPAIMEHWAQFLRAVARMELRGIPIDVPTSRLILHSREAIREDLIAEVNRTRRVFREGSFRRRAFLAWCRSQGIDWPCRPSPTTGRPYFPLDDETMEDMEGRHPFIGEVRQVRKTLLMFGRRPIVVDGVLGRHYFGTSVFRSVTGRNQPRGFLFAAPKWMRWLAVPPSTEHVLTYVDFIAQEVGIAAALSGDPAMRAVYETSDAHLAFARRAGAVPSGAYGKALADIRKKYKTVSIGTLYGQTAFGVSARLGITRQEAQGLLDQHRELFPTFWDWSERVVQGAYDRGEMRTPCGWGSKVPPFSNERTWMNFPVQATGGDIMRLVVTYLDRQNVEILAPVHDGFLISARRDQLSVLRAAVDFACRTAVEQVLPGFPLRWELIVHDGGRFEDEDEDGKSLWEKIRSTLLRLYPTDAAHLR